MSYFPVFIELKDCPCLVVGGSEIAAKKAAQLILFGANVTVVAEQFCEDFDVLSSCKFIKKPFHKRLLKGMQLVIAATTDSWTNHEVTVWCQENKIPVHSITRKADSTFLFPEIVDKEGVCAGILCDGRNPMVLEQIKEWISESIPDGLGNHLDQLEEVQDWLKESVVNQELRKKVYGELNAMCLENTEITKEIANQVIHRVIDEVME